jgi:hypothetical protein
LHDVRIDHLLQAEQGIPLLSCSPSRDEHVPDDGRAASVMRNDDW